MLRGVVPKLLGCGLEVRPHFPGTFFLTLMRFSRPYTLTFRYICTFLHWILLLRNAKGSTAMRGNSRGLCLEGPVSRQDCALSVAEVATFLETPKFYSRIQHQA